MADISAEIAAFKNAVYGEDVRDAMVSLANKLNSIYNYDYLGIFANNTDLNDVKLNTIGLCSSIRTYLNIPSDIQEKALVLTAGDSSYVYQLIFTFGTTPFKSYHRYGNSWSSISSWVNIDDASKPPLQFFNSVANLTDPDANNFEQQSIYYKHSSISVLHMPNDYDATTGIIITLKAAAYSVQFYVTYLSTTYTPKIFMRWYTDTWGDWTVIWDATREKSVDDQLASIRKRMYGERYTFNPVLAQGTIAPDGWVYTSQTSRLRIPGLDMFLVNGTTVTVNSTWAIRFVLYKELLTGDAYWYANYPGPSTYVTNTTVDLSQFDGYYCNIVVEKVGHESDNITGEIVNAQNAISISSCFEKYSVREYKAIIPSGPIKLPDEFGSIPFDIIKTNTGWKSSVNYNALVSKNVTTIYISDHGTGTDGLDENNPITLYAAKQHILNFDYGHGDLKFVFVDDTYFIEDQNNFVIIGTATDAPNAMFTSKKFTWIGNGKRSPEWTTDNNLLTCQSSKNIVDICDLTNLDSYGMPKIYHRVESVSDLTEPGTFCVVDNVVTVYPYDLDDDLSLVYGYSWSASIDTIMRIQRVNAGRMIFTNLGFLSDASNFRDSRTLDCWWYFYNCRWHRGAQDSFMMDGKYKALVENCVADYSSKDCFNWHATSKDCVGIEINCTAYGAGKYKETSVSGYNTTTNSNNASTAHDGMCLARFGCDYWSCEGGICADVYNVVSFVVDCSCRDVLQTISPTTRNVGYMFEGNAGAPSDRTNRTTAPIVYLINSIAEGDMDYALRLVDLDCVCVGLKSLHENYTSNANIIERDMFL